MQLTNSQTKAIESQKRIIELVHPGAAFQVWQPARTTRLIATYKVTNVLGNETEVSQSWTIGKRGKVTK